VGTTVVAILSILLGAAAAVVALSLAWVTRDRWVWVLIGAAMLLLAVMRSLHLASAPLDTVTEALYLMLSLLMLAGLLAVRPLCRTFHTSVERLSEVEQALEEARRKLHDVLHYTPLIVFAVDRDGIFTLSEGRGLVDLGLKPGQVVGQYVYDVYKDVPEIGAAIRRALTGEAFSADVDVVDRSYEVHYSPVYGDRGSIVGVFGVAVDVSQRKRSEAQLRATKDRFRALVETTSDWMWEVDSDGVYTYASPKVKELLGYEPDELIGKTPFDLMRPGAVDRFRGRFMEYVERRDPFAGLVNVALHKDGREVMLETSGVPVFDDDGNVIGYRGIDRDITERKRAEEALRASEARLNLALVSADMGTWEWDIKANRLVWSQKAEELYGLERGAFGGAFEDYLALVHDEDRDHAQFAVNAALKGKVSPLRVLHRVIRPDGETRWIESTGRVVRDDSGQPIRMLGLVADVTDRELGERKLRKEKETAQMYLDVVGVIIVALDAEGTVDLINQKGCEILGYDERDIVGTNWFENFVPEDLREEVGAAFKRLIKGDVEPFEYFENRVLTRSGEERLVAWHNAVIRDEDDNIVGTLSSGSDITEIRVAEQMKRELEDQLRHSQRVETIGTLAGGIAHDFNNILAPILGYVDIAMEDAGKDSPIYEYLEQVNKATHRAKELVEQILLFSKQTDQETSPIYIHLVIREALRLVRASLPTTIEIQQNINIDAGVVMANTAQMHQVLINLCANAAHAMRDTGGVLRVSLVPAEVDEELAREHPKLRPGPYALLTVSDTGHGMDEQTMERIFEPFFTTKDVGEGTGLGLSVVHGIVTNHGGDILVESEPGKGTTVSVYIPHTDMKTAVVEETEDIDVRGHESVLFVDDEPDIVELGRRILGKLGYKVTTAADGEEALKILRSDPYEFDIVVSDQTMPKKTGLVLTKEIRAIRRDMPVVLMTGYSDKVTPEILEEMRVNNLIMKPLAGKSLSGAIRQALDNNLARGDE
jgi:PAS domain S-box-containing protein